MENSVGMDIADGNISDRKQYLHKVSGVLLHDGMLNQISVTE